MDYQIDNNQILTPIEIEKIKKYLMDIKENPAVVSFTGKQGTGKRNPLMDIISK